MILEDDTKGVDYFNEKYNLDLQNRENELKSKQLQMETCYKSIKMITKNFNELNESYEIITQKMSSLQKDKAE